jgi:asparagine synthase (glutamine-hydrolysing)
MSAILGVFSRSGPLPPDTEATAMLRRMGRRGAEHLQVWRGSSCVLGVSRFGWEMEDGFSGPVLVLESDGVVVAADATLYYRADLLRALNTLGVNPTGTTASHLILAAYRAWGEAFVERLEGDFALVLWDLRARRAFCARDGGVKRPLFWGRFGDTTVVASEISGILAHPACPRELNLVTVGEHAAGLWSNHHDTGYRAVQHVPHGAMLVWDGGEPRIVRHWEPPRFETGDGPPVRQAAEQLRALLTQAVAERLAPAGPTATQLSGGWDSTSVFAAAMHYLHPRGEDDRLQPISVSYPPGDPGREDELIQATLDFWDKRTHWIDVATIPIFDRPEARAAERDDVYAHGFEIWNRRVAREARNFGARVMLDGVGGDQLFQVSNVYFADLLGRGRLRELRREIRAKSVKRWADLFPYAVQPLLPDWMLRLPAWFGAPRRSLRYLERWPAPWMRRDFVRRSGMLEREHDAMPRQRNEPLSAYESRWYLTSPFFPRAFLWPARLSLEAGIESRSPLFDRRVVDFAARRPRWERSSGRETKWLLRTAVHGLVPEGVLAPRPFRTGLAGGHFRRGMTHDHRAEITRLLASDLCLAELGIVEPAALRRAWDGYLQVDDGSLGSALFATYHTELWLRSRLRNGVCGADAAEPSGTERLHA